MQSILTCAISGVHQTPAILVRFLAGVGYAYTLQMWVRAWYEQQQHLTTPAGLTAQECSPTLAVVMLCRDNAIPLATSRIPNLSLVNKRKALQAAVDYILTKGRLLCRLLQDRLHCSGGSGTTHTRSGFGVHSCPAPGDVSFANSYMPMQHCTI